MRGLIPNLWFDNEAEDAASFYTGIFKDSKVLNMLRYPKAATGPSGKPEGSVLTVDFEIAGQRFSALNGGPDFKFNESVSFMIMCDDQKEVDYFWSRLTNGGEESACGWLKDKFGLSRQVVPVQLEDMMGDADQAKVEAVTAAFMKMSKLDLPTLEAAYASA